MRSISGKSKDFIRNELIKSEIYSAFYNEKEKRFITKSLLTEVCLKKYNLENPEIYRKKNGILGVRNLPKVNFALSHSSNLCICTYSEKQIGLDLEYIKDRPLNFDHISSKLEQELFDINSLVDFYKIWLMKESTIKAVQSGVFESFKDTEIIGRAKIDSEYLSKLEDTTYRNSILIVDGYIICKTTPLE